MTVFVGFLIALDPRLTGTSIHEWFTLSLAGMLIVHFLLHWDWFIKLSLRFFENLYHSSRLNYALAILIFLGFITIITSGLMISEHVMPFFGLNDLGGHGWKTVHELASNLTLFLVAIHVALRWEWVKTTISKFFIDPFIGRFGHKQKNISIKEQ